MNTAPGVDGGVGIGEKIILAAALGKALRSELAGKIRRRDFSAGVPFHTIAPLHPCIPAPVRAVAWQNQRDVLYCL